MTELIIRGDRVLNREDGGFEAKSFTSGVPESLWETYSAFANTSGGTIVLGLNESQDGDGYVTGGVPNAEGIRDDLWSTLNNPQKVSVNVMMDADLRIVEAGGRRIIVMNVPEADRSLRPVFIRSVNSGTYKRNGSGDYHCNANEIAAMYRDASPDSRDRLATSEALLSDLRSDSIEGFRSLMAARRPTNEWLKEPLDEFLRLIGAATRSKGELRPTYAGIMMFGDEASISAEVPGFSLDYREYDVGGEEWTLRRQSGTPGWSGNLFDFYTYVVGRIPVQVGTGFSVPDGINRQEDTPLVRTLREAVTNAVTNADYWGRGGIVIESRPDGYRVRNAGTFRISIVRAEAGGETDPRNEVLMKMIGLITNAEKAGTGVRMMFSSCRRLGLDPPSIEETQRPDMVSVSVRYGTADPSEKLAAMVLELVRRDPKVTTDAMAEELGVRKSAVVRALDGLKRKGTLTRVGGPRGRWEVAEGEK